MALKYPLSALGWRLVDKSRVAFARNLLQTFSIGNFIIADGLPVIQINNKFGEFYLEYDWVENVIYVSAPHASKTYKLIPTLRSDLVKIYALLTWASLAENNFLGVGYYGWQTILS